MTEQLLVASVLVLVGLAALSVALWLRIGRPRPLRSWMDPFHEQWIPERIVLLGLPTAGGLLLCTGVFVLASGLLAVQVLAVLGMAVLVIPGLYFLAAPLPLPEFLFPRWAREVRAHREEAFRAWVRGARR